MSNQTIFRNTKHKGRTFEYVRKNEPGYVNWAKSITDPHGSLAEFVAYCKSQDEAEGKPVNVHVPSPQMLNAWSLHCKAW